MIVKVKEPIEPDLKRLRKDHLLFCYLHLAALPELTRRLCSIGLTAVAFETVEDRAGRLPLLAPMSDIAGRLSMQYATTLLHQPQGGKGILLGGVPAAKRGKVVVLGGGVAGGNSALVAAGLGAEVIVFDKDRDKLVAARAMGANVTGLYPHVADVADAVRDADVVIGAVLVTGARAPHVVSADMVRTMEAGSVIVDITVDQGGCIETTQAHDLGSAHVPVGRRHAFLRHEHAGLGAAHLVAGAVGGHRAVRRAAGGWRLADDDPGWSAASTSKAARSRIRRC